MKKMEMPAMASGVVRSIRRWDALLVAPSTHIRMYSSGAITTPGCVLKRQRASALGRIMDASTWFMDMLMNWWEVQPVLSRMSCRIGWRVAE